MPYYKKSKSRYGKYSTYTKVKRPLYGRLDRKAYQMAKTALSLINTETKYLDTAASATPALAGTVVQCSLISQGDGARARTGDSLKVVSIMVRINWSINASATSTNIRWMLVLDTQPNKAVFSTDDLLQNLSAGLNIITPLEFNQGGRYNVMASGRQNITNTGGGNQSKFVNKFMKKSIHIRYAANNGDITDLQKNNICLVLLSSEATNFPLIYYHVRLRFIDN